MKHETYENDLNSLHELASMHSTMTADYSSLSDECAALTVRLEETQACLLDSESQVRQMRLTEAQLTGRIQECQSSLTEWQRERDTLVTGLRTRVDTLQRERDSGRESVESVRRRLAEVESEWSVKEAEWARQTESVGGRLAESEAKLASAEQSASAAEASMRMEWKISSRKQEQLVKELKAQLKKEVIKCQSLTGQLLLHLDSSRRSAATTTTESLGFHSVSPVVPPPPPPRADRGVSHRREASREESESSRSRVFPGEMSMARQVTDAMSAKLLRCEEDKHKLKAKVSYLSTSIQALQDDLAAQRLMVANLTRRVKCGALTLTDGDGGATSSGAVSAEMYAQMGKIYEETMLQNELLRRDIEAMGGEVQALLRDNEALRGREPAD